MTEFIILSRGDIMTLCKDEPVKIWIDKRPMLLCSDEYFERQKAEDKYISGNMKEPHLNYEPCPVTQEELDKCLDILRGNEDD